MISEGDLLRSRVVADLAPALEDALDRRLDGYAVLEPRDALLGAADDRGVVTFEDGVPALAYHVGADRGGPPALADIGAGPYRLEESWLAEEGYVGSIDVNSIVDETGVYPLEFTPRFGYPTITLQEEGLRTPTGEFLYRPADGDDAPFSVHRGYQIGVRVVLPPFPFDDERIHDENSRDAAIVFETDDREGIHFEDAKRVDGQRRAAGDSGMPLVVTGTGETMAAAREQAYERIEDVIVPTCTTATTSTSAGSRRTPTGCRRGDTSARSRNAVGAPVHGDRERVRYRHRRKC